MSLNEDLSLPGWFKAVLRRRPNNSMHGRAIDKPLILDVPCYRLHLSPQRTFIGPSSVVERPGVLALDMFFLIVRHS